MSLFPSGIAPYLTGGLLIGAGVGLIFLTTGIIAGASSFFSSTWSWVSSRDCFHQRYYLDSRVWRVIFTVGLVGGALLFTFLANDGETFVTEVQTWRLVLGGFLVGLGTRVSRGCTSGHGICGLSAWSFPSLLAVLTFMGVAIATAHLAGRLGVSP